MYSRYALKRISYMMITFIIIIFIYSALFNAVMDKTLKSQIQEQVKGEIMSLTNMSSKQIETYRRNRIKSLRKRYHLDEPVISRIFWRGIDILTLKWGKSTIITSSAGSRKVTNIIAEVVPRTILLFTVAALVDILIGVGLGIKKAQKPGEFLDQSTSIMTMIVQGLPSWWLAMIMIMIFVYAIPIFPSGGLHSIPPPQGVAYYLDLLHHLALPVLTLVIIGFWGRAYLTRNIVLGTLQEDYIISARARGLPEGKVLYGHALRSAAPPIATMGVMSLLISLQGSLIYEGIFSWPGMGNLYWVAVQQNDIPVLLGLLAVTTALYLGGLVFLDLIYGFLDPRIKVGDKR